MPDPDSISSRPDHAVSVRGNRLMRQATLVERVRAYDPDADESILNRAYVFAMQAHGPQKRASGDPYFSHPLEVAGILTDLKLDTATIATALLHDTVEDTSATIEDIEKNFGAEIAGLVDGVTKLSQLELFSERTKQAENFRKLMLAMSNDIRVLLVKLADRLHNMRTISHVKDSESRLRVAQETIEIYAPLAGRIGMQNMREELEDLAFAVIDPEARESIVRRMQLLDAQSSGRIARIADEIRRKLAENGIEAWVQGRAKRPYSIWRKLKDKKTNFEQLSDVFGFRAVVASIEDCYRALGVLHRAWPMVPERFKDFISLPKSNGYRSIHTTVMGPENQRVEVQIRTQEMHEVAERGVAAHWQYREKVSETDPTAVRAYEWLRDMVELIERGESPEEFYEHSKLSLYQDQVFCFTPKGNLIALPRGATPIDFAYFVHTDVGNTAVGAKVNGAHTPLHTPLKNGDQVEIICSREQTPSPVWERFAVTGRARAEIRRFLRHAQRDQQVSLGRKILEKVFADEGFQLTDKAIEGVLRKLRLARADDVYAAVGRGALRSDDVLEAVYPELRRDPNRKRPTYREPQSTGVSIAGLTEGVGYRLGSCCHPIPGDRIIGLMVPGEGCIVHTIDCEVLDRYQDSMADWVDVRWKDHGGELSVARIIVRVKNTTGALAALANVIGHNGANISNFKITSRNPLYFEFLVDVEVRDAAHLENLIRALKVDATVEAVERVRGLEAEEHPPVLPRQPEPGQGVLPLELNVH
jgi:guanosine-3',5'-bis(diphosphate) 3'-pyrophosphohydrolase